MFQPFIWSRGVSSRISSSISMESWSSTSIGFIGFFHIYLDTRKKPGSNYTRSNGSKLGGVCCLQNLGRFAPKWCMTPPNLQAKTHRKYQNWKSWSREVSWFSGYQSKDNIEITIFALRTPIVATVNIMDVSENSAGPVPPKSSH